MNFFDKAVSMVFPPWARWAFQRDQLLRFGAYEAAQPGRNRKAPKEHNSGNVAVERGAASIRAQARALDQNHDIAKGILTSMVNKIVGPHGIGVEFMPKTLTGEIHDDFASTLTALFEDWSKRPEVTKQFSLTRADRISCRTWLRDGEVFRKTLEGSVRGLQHSTDVQLSFEMLEPDYVPLDLSVPDKRITQGIETNAWGQRTWYHVLKDHPGDYGIYAMDTKRVRADRMLHAAMIDRIHQLRGVSVFASVLTRLQDIKDYEESERVAARIAAAMAAYIRKGEPVNYTSVDGTSGQERHIKFAPGMVFDGLRPGEDIGTISHNRPNTNLGTHRADMLKAVAAGSGSQYSTISKNYDGNYSSQRQELIEQQGNYLVLTDEFIDQLTAPTVEKFIRMAVASGEVKLPQDLDRATLYDVEYQGPALPWIDPVKEAQGYLQLVRGGFSSRTKVIRMLGSNPRTMTQQIKRERDEADDQRLVFTSDSKHEVKANEQKQKVVRDSK